MYSNNQCHVCNHNQQLIVYDGFDMFKAAKYNPNEFAALDMILFTAVYRV